METASVLSAADFRRVQELVYRRAGIRLVEAKLPLAQNRLARRVRATGSAGFGEYLGRAASDPAEEQRCIEALTTNETFFFRHKEHWDWFIARILANHPRSKPMRVWSAAASTGEEAHSIAIACREHAPDLRVQIEASDLNAQVIANARAGIYGDYALQKLTDYARQRWFTRSGEGWQAKSDVRGLIRWGQANLMEPLAGPPCDVVFLRNVLIYFDDQSKAKALANVMARIPVGGWLFLGGSETIPTGTRGLKSVKPQIFQRSEEV